MIFFALLAAAGLILSATAYLSTFVGVDPNQPWPCMVFLDLGMFLVLIPAAVSQPSKRPGQQYTWRDVTGNAPAWMRWLIFLFLANAVISAVTFSYVCKMGGPSREPDGTYAFTSHGRIIEHISVAEYDRARRYDLRFFVSWPMAAYSLATTLLVSEIRRPKRRKERAVVVPGIHRGVMPVWLHHSLLIFCMGFGWIGIPFLTATYVLPLLGKFQWWYIFAIIGSAFFGVIVPATLLRKYVPARCPDCGGRAYCQSLLDRKYGCIDCEQVRFSR